MTSAAELTSAGLIIAERLGVTPGEGRKIAAAIVPPPPKWREGPLGVTDLARTLPLADLAALTPVEDHP